MIRMIARYGLKVWSDWDTTATGQTAGQWAFELKPLDHAEDAFLADGRETNITSDRLELLAFVRGLEALDDPCWVYLSTESQYVRHGLKYGIGRWKQNEWRWENAGIWVPVKHADLWKRVDRAMDIHRLAWRRGTAIDGAANDFAGYRQKAQSQRERRPMRSWSHQSRDAAVLVA